MIQHQRDPLDGTPPHLWYQHLLEKGLSGYKPLAPGTLPNLPAHRPHSSLPADAALHVDGSAATGRAGSSAEAAVGPVQPRAPESRFSRPRRRPRFRPSTGPAPSHTTATRGAPVPKSGEGSGYVATSDSARDGSVQRATSGQSYWPRRGARPAWPLRDEPVPLDSSAPAARPLGCQTAGDGGRLGTYFRGKNAGVRLCAGRRRGSGCGPTVDAICAPFGHWCQLWASCWLLQSGCSCAIITIWARTTSQPAPGRWYAPESAAASARLPPGSTEWVYLAWVHASRIPPKPKTLRPQRRFVKLGTDLR